MEENSDKVKNRTVFYRLNAPKPAHINKLADSTADQHLARLLECRASATKALLSASNDCLALAMSPARGEHLSTSEKLLIAKKIANIDPFKALVIETMAQDQVLANVHDTDLFFALVLQTSEGYLDSALNSAVHQNLLGLIAQDSRVANLLEKLATTKKATILARSLLALDVSALDTKASFYLGILAVQLDRLEVAQKAFEHSKKVAYSKNLQDRAIFWQWLISADQRYLVELSKSESVSFYALYAKDLLGVNYPSVTEKVGGGSKKPATSKKELYNPFFWANLHRKISSKNPAVLNEELAKLGTDQAYEPYRAAIYIHQAPSSTHIFLDSFADQMSSFDTHQKAFFMAVMRQESRFVPAALSTSYAMGTMQMMPFLIDHMKKERKDKRDLWQFFDPSIQIPYAKRHIDWLEKKLTHPLYVAYAYNGGIGYTNRSLENYKLFHRGKYEPFMSMERITVEETREYGKIVLANYAVYSALFGKKISVVELAEKLTPIGDLY